MDRKVFAYKAPEDSPEKNVLEIGDEKDPEKVQLVDAVDGLILLDFTAKMRDQKMDAGKRASSLIEFIRECTGCEGEEDSDAYKEFQRLVRKYKIDIEGIGDIAGYLADMYSERPTLSAESSTAGQTTTGDSSEASSSSEESIPAA